jgi:hypothetical protein
MKKITLLAAAFVAITFASCKKDRTCACTTSTVDSGTDYFTSYNSSTGTTYQDSDPISDVQTSTDEVSFEKISKKYGREQCATKATSSYDYDYTSTSGGFTYGEAGKRTTTQTCELK